MRSLAMLGVAGALVLCAGARARGQCALVGDACDDGLFCSVDDTCDGALNCVGAARNCDDGNPCTLDQCTESAASCESPAAPAGTPCSDSVFCTDGDACDGAGGCVAGGPRDCNDGQECTSDACDEASGSCNNVLADACIIRGDCVPTGGTDPRDACARCDPTVATNRYTATPAGGACGAASCVDGTLTPPPLCDATGSCVASAPTACSVPVCRDGTVCGECASDADCPASERCDLAGAVCVEELPAGTDGAVTQIDGGGGTGTDGAPPPTALVAHGSGCSRCEAASASRGQWPLALVIGGAALALAVARRRRRAVSQPLRRSPRRPG